MIILGIETSCDETAAAVVEETGDVARPWVVCLAAWPVRSLNAHTERQLAVAEKPERYERQTRVTGLWMRTP